LRAERYAGRLTEVVRLREAYEEDAARTPLAHPTSQYCGKIAWAMRRSALKMPYELADENYCRCIPEFVAQCLR
jgi:hypothetical protein